MHLWNLGFIKDKTKGKYKEIEDKISNALAFMEACGINPDNNRRLRTVNFYTSHEALHLPFEESMTRSRLNDWRISRYFSSFCMDRR